VADYLREVISTVRAGQHERQCVHKIDASLLDVRRGAHWVVLCEAVHGSPGYGPEDARVGRGTSAWLEKGSERDIQENKDKSQYL